MADAACQQGVCGPGLHVYGVTRRDKLRLCLGFLGCLCEPCGCMGITWWPGAGLAKEHLALQLPP